MIKEPYILYIEDERPSIELVRTILDLAGYKMKGVTSGEQGLVLMRDHKPTLLLLDLVMPATSGLDIYREMKHDPDLADIPVIVITGKVPENGLILIQGLPPVNDYLTKPFKPDRLVRAVREAVKVHSLEDTIISGQQSMIRL